MVVWHIFDMDEKGLAIGGVESMANCILESRRAQNVPEANSSLMVSYSSIGYFSQIISLYLEKSLGTGSKYQQDKTQKGIAIITLRVAKALGQLVAGEYPIVTGIILGQYSSAKISTSKVISKPREQFCGQCRLPGDTRNSL